MIKACLSKHKNKGVKTEATVVRNSWRYNSGPREYICYVEYLDEDNQKHEAELDAVLVRPIPVGRIIKIKYIPPEYKKVVFLSREVN